MAHFSLNKSCKSETYFMEVRKDYLSLHLFTPKPTPTKVWAITVVASTFTSLCQNLLVRDLAKFLVSACSLFLDFFASVF
jgi:hypothetical protein